MVFCYKIITETPRRSGTTSPVRRAVPTNIPSSLSQLVGTVDYEASDVLDIPERDWRLLAALAKKRDESDERERLAEEFQRMWQKEKEEREMVEAETLDQYKRYLAQKRHQERLRLEHKQLRQATEQQLKQGELLNCIRYKQRRSDDLRALIIDQKVTDIVDKALEEEARATLAANRRLRQSAAEECRRQLDLADARRREDDALRRRNAMLRDASQLDMIELKRREDDALRRRNAMLRDASQIRECNRDIVHKALEEAGITLAKKWRKQLDLADARRRREDDALRRRNAMLRDASQVRKEFML
ncbi:trichohyalin-like [Ostrinia furnacalis]|uniref:trichohyalin-like n=1 Tax=Ostrinia furnacalis TaxID=93504 RepID=UPI00103E9DE2|nr:trichohyalin-like [Ostrinia furnacalis]